MSQTPHDPLDAWLDSAKDVEPSARLQRVIAEIPLRHPRAAQPAWWPGSLWKLMTAGAIACALGAVAGAGSVDAADVAATTTVEIDDTMMDGAELAFAIGFDEESGP